MFNLAKIKSILHAEVLPDDHSIEIDTLSIDSRRIINGKKTLFICLHGDKRDGHDYINDAYNKGVRVALVSRRSLPRLEGLKYIHVDHVLGSLQLLAAKHRESMVDIKILGITGSNAKTIIKEWLFQICHPEIDVLRSPKSYNSQIGVALSLALIQPKHQWGIIEAGISTVNEMDNIEQMIQPDLGIFTNIGQAHSGGFSNIKQKIAEKSKLFKNCHKIIVHSGHIDIVEHLESTYGRDRLIKWGGHPKDDIVVKTTDNNTLLVRKSGTNIAVPLTSTDRYHIENLAHCIVAALTMEIDKEVITRKISLLHSLDMRLEHIQGRHNSLIINDAYIADLTSLKVAIHHIKTLQHKGPLCFILSDFYDLDAHKGDYDIINEMLSEVKLDRLITVGKNSEQLHISNDHFHFPDTKSIMNHLDSFDWTDYLILLKGARQYHLDTLVSKLEKSSHSALLEINIPALHHNITQIKKSIPQGSGFIPVLKASAYGSGIERIAEAIESHQPDFIAVAYTDEGIRLRQYGIKSRIIILNSDINKADLLFEYDLEPEVHTTEMLSRLSEKAESVDIPLQIHLKLDTGMHRLGFMAQDLAAVKESIINNPYLKVATVFSHLSASDDPEHDGYTLNQIQRFNTWADEIDSVTHHQPGRHILNSEGIWRFPEHSMDFVRAGITLYGISAWNHSLNKVHALYARVISIKSYPKGSDIGYGRSQSTLRPSLIAVINMGYADGLMRSGSNGKIGIYINGKTYPVIGRICMDVTMVDITGSENIKIGDRAEVFGNHISIVELAEQLNTIPYEILCRISQRVVRKYIME